MDLSHRDLPAAAPLAVRFAKLRVAVAVGVLPEVLLVQQLERHARPAQLLVQVRRVGQCAPRRLLGRIEPALQRHVIERLGGRPVEAGRAGAGHAFADRTHAHAQRPRDLAVAPAQLQFQSKYFSGLPHGQSLRGHRLSSEAVTRGRPSSAALCRRHRHSATSFLGGSDG